MSQANHLRKHPRGKAAFWFACEHKSASLLLGNPCVSSSWRLGFAARCELSVTLGLCALAGRGVNPPAQSHHCTRRQRLGTRQTPRGSADVHQTQIPPGKKIKSVFCPSQKMSEELRRSVSTKSSGFFLWLMRTEKTFCSLCLPDLIYTRHSPASHQFSRVLSQGCFVYLEEVHAKCRKCIFSKVEIT